MFTFKGKTIKTLISVAIKTTISCSQLMLRACCFLQCYVQVKWTFKFLFKTILYQEMKYIFTDNTVYDLKSNRCTFLYDQLNFYVNK